MPNDDNKRDKVDAAGDRAELHSIEGSDEKKDRHYALVIKATRPIVTSSRCKSKERLRDGGRLQKASSSVGVGKCKNDGLSGGSQRRQDCKDSNVGSQPSAIWTEPNGASTNSAVTSSRRKDEPGSNCSSTRSPQSLGLSTATVSDKALRDSTRGHSSRDAQCDDSQRIDKVAQGQPTAGSGCAVEEPSSGKRSHELRKNVSEGKVPEEANGNDTKSGRCACGNEEDGNECSERPERERPKDIQEHSASGKSGINNCKLPRENRELRGHEAPAKEPQGDEQCSQSFAQQDFYDLHRPGTETEVDHSIIHLFNACNWSKRQIARQLGVSRNKVRRVLAKHEARRNGCFQPAKRLPMQSIISPWIQNITELLDKFPNISGIRIMEEIEKFGYKGSYSTLKNTLRELRPKNVEAVIRFETDPGEQAQMDWSPCKIPLVNGQIKKISCFSYILGYSRRQYLAFVDGEDFYTLTNHHLKAFQYLEGCAKTCLYDNMKTVVARREANVPIYNPRFLLFASHYGFKPWACDKQSPETKGKVERPFRYIKGNFLNGRKFADIEHLRKELKLWLKNTAEVRIHGTTNRRPIDLWEEEKPSLIPLPKHLYRPAEIAYRLVSVEALVAWKGNHYSVPPAYIGQFVIVKAVEEIITILSSNFGKITQHELQTPSKGVKVRHPEHRIKRVNRSKSANDIIRNQFNSLCEQAPEYLVGLAKQHPTRLRSHLAKILHLRELYHTKHVAKAILHALKFQAFDSKVIERLLILSAPQRSLEAAIASAGNDGDGAFDRPRTKQRKAAYYQNIFERHSSGKEKDEESNKTNKENGKGTELPR